MGTVHRLTFQDRPPGGDDRGDDSWELELPGWEEFTVARDRFFAGLRSAAELYRNGAVATDEDGEPRGEARA